MDHFASLSSEELSGFWYFVRTYISLIVVGFSIIFIIALFPWNRE